MRKSLSLAGALLVLAATTAQAEKFHIEVKGSDGSTPIQNVQVQYVTSQFYNVGTTDASGVIDADFPALSVGAKYSLKFTYKGTSYTTDKFTATGDKSIAINTAKLVVNTIGNNGEGVNGLTPQFVNATGGSYYSMPATVNGVSCIELLSTYNLKVKVNANGSYMDQLADNGSIPPTFVLSKVTIPGASFLAGTSGIGSWISLSNGLYVFPGTHTIRINNKVTETFEVGNTDINANALIVRLVSSIGQPISGATVDYGVSEFVAAAPTNANGNSLIFTNADPAYLFTQVTYRGANQMKQGGFVGNVLTYQTRNYTVNFKNQAGTEGVIPESVQFGVNEYKPFTTLADGTGKMELLPHDYFFLLTYGGASQQKWIPISDSVVDYSTKVYTVNFKDSKGNPLKSESVQYGVGYYLPFTNITNEEGSAQMELLPHDYFFMLTYGGASQQKSILEAESVVNFSTKQVTMNVKNCKGSFVNASGPQYGISHYENFGDATGMVNGIAVDELLPSAYPYFFTVNLNGTSKVLTQIVADIEEPQVVNFVAANVNISWPQHTWVSGKYYASNGFVGDMRHEGNAKSGDIDLFPGYYTFTVDGKSVSTTVTDQCVSFNFKNVARIGGMNTELSVYPNPATDFINVTMPEAGSVSIFSMDGRKVASQEMTAGANRMDVSSFLPGTYMLVNGTETIKFVKQ